MKILLKIVVQCLLIMSYMFAGISIERHNFWWLAFILVGSGFFVLYGILSDSYD